MLNFNLNAGGLFGGLAFGVIVATVIFSNIDPANVGRAAYKLPILALIVGAFVGNYLFVVQKAGGGARNLRS